MCPPLLWTWVTASTWDLEGETIPTWFDLLIFDFRFFEFLEGETIPTWFDFWFLMFWIFGGRDYPHMVWLLPQTMKSTAFDRVFPIIAPKFLLFFWSLTQLYNMNIGRWIYNVYSPIPIFTPFPGACQWLASNVPAGDPQLFLEKEIELYQMLLLEMLLLLLEIQPYQMLLLAMLPPSWALFAMMIGQTVTEHIHVRTRPC